MTLSEIIGSKVKLLRTESGKTQDQVAAVARACGVDWGRSTVAALEDGSKRLSADELLLLPFIVAGTFDCDFYLADLVTPMDTDPDGAWVSLGSDARMTYTAIAMLLGGTASADSTNPDMLDMPWTRSRQRALEIVAERRKTYKRIWPGAPVGELGRAEKDARGESEQKAARRLGVSAEEVAVAARRLWGQGLTAERDERVARQRAELEGRSLQAVRGHVTRALLQELRPIVQGGVPLSDAEKERQRWRKYRFASGTSLGEAWDKRHGQN